MRQSTQIIQRIGFVGRDIVYRVRSIHRDAYLLKETRVHRKMNQQIDVD